MATRVVYFRFQFHKGTIRTQSSRGIGYSSCHFNSIKVQLEQLYDTIIYILRKFQFHKGTIRTTEVTPSLVEDNISIP